MPDIKLGGLFYEMAIKGQQKVNQAVEKSKGKFSKFGSTVKSAAGQVPILGGALQQMLTPMGAATVAGTAFVGFLVSSVKHVIDLEKNLRPMIERSNLSAESLQELTKVAERLGSEDGLEGVTDGAQELQLRLAEAVADGTGPAVEAFAKLGLASEDLIKKSPEESFLDVIGALQEYDDEAQKKFLADELMGGASEKLSGIINTNAEDFANLRSEIQKTHRFMTDEELEKVQGYATAMEDTGANIDSLKTSIGLELLPVVAEGAKVFGSAVDKSQDFGVTLVGLAATVLPAAAIAYRLFNDEGEALVETTEEVTVALVEEKEAIEEVTEAAVEGINAQLLSVQNKRDAVKEYQEWYKTYVKDQIKEFKKEEKAFTVQIGNLEKLRDKTLLAAKRRNDELVRDSLETAQEKAEIAADEKEIARLQLIEDIKNSVRREELLHRFKFLSADIQDEIREEAYQHGIKLTDVIEDYLENILNVRIDTNDAIVDDQKETDKELEKLVKEAARAAEKAEKERAERHLRLLKSSSVGGGRGGSDRRLTIAERAARSNENLEGLARLGNVSQQGQRLANERLNALDAAGHGDRTDPNDIQLANGGIVTGPTIATIGEAGPEAVIPLGPVSVVGGWAVLPSTVMFMGLTTSPIK